MKRIHRLRRQFVLLAAIVTTALAFGAQAELRLPAVFSDHMVLQQGKALPVWGWADNGEVVTVEFRGQKVSAMARGGKWSVKLRSLKAGGADVLTVATKTKKIQFSDVLVGEVWVCSGQSNMEWPMSKSFEPTNDIAAATNKFIRVFLVPKSKLDAPTNDVVGRWELCSPASIESFSAVGYYFGRSLQKSRGVPVGLIGTYWGGTPAEAWTRNEFLAANPRYKTELLDAFALAWKEYETGLAAYEKEKEAAKQTGLAFNKKSPREPWKPSVLYNGMIAPLIPYAIQGAIWYQGESNARSAEQAIQYRALFPDMIRNWRQDWAQGDFTFLCVQLAPYRAFKPQPDESDWAILREAQLRATQVLPTVGMAVITDIGDEKNIHPAKKEPVGERLALAARHIAYGEKIEFSGPVYRSMKVKGGKVILRFDQVGKGLEARDGELKGFAICGEDKKFVWAKAEILPDNTVAVSSPEVAKPVAVRYGWADFPVVNLWSKNGLPATPFRTDSFAPAAVLQK
ncbi:MAG: sialate O-acetylesterase [Verrucomicrobia bacterium]|nr:sialate O-acetylesterase [Verrucomicrobiota bacterium]